MDLVFFKRNHHNLEKTFFRSANVHKNKFFYETLKKISLKKGKKNFYINLINCYKILIKEKIFLKKRNEFS